MGNLTAKSPFGTLLPVRIGAVSLTEAEAAAVTWLAPLKGHADAVSKALAEEIGVGLPEVGRAVKAKGPGKGSGKGSAGGSGGGSGGGVAGGARVVWAGPGQVFVIGPALGQIAGAATVDHSSAWARMVLDGGDEAAEDGARTAAGAAAGAAAVLARLVPVDLRDAAFGIGRTARTQLGHMACSLTRTGSDRYEIMVFRSMAASALHEMTRAMEMVAARARSAE